MIRDGHKWQHDLKMVMKQASSCFVKSWFGPFLPEQIKVWTESAVIKAWSGSGDSPLPQGFSCPCGPLPPLPVQAGQQKTGASSWTLQRGCTFPTGISCLPIYTPPCKLEVEKIKETGGAQLLQLVNFTFSQLIVKESNWPKSGSGVGRHLNTSWVCFCFCEPWITWFAKVGKSWWVIICALLAHRITSLVFLFMPIPNYYGYLTGVLSI